MIFALLMTLLQADVSELNCSAPGSVRTCRAADGSTYIERVVGNRVIRQATDSNGESWTEYVITEAGGTRLVGQDASGRTWTQHCSPTSGTHGTERNGESVYKPPRHVVDRSGVADATMATSYASCPDAVEEFDSNQRVLRELTARETARRDQRRRQRRHGL